MTLAVGGTLNPKSTIQITREGFMLAAITAFIRAAARENRSSGFPTRSDTNRPVQSQKQARSLKFRI